ncbi:DinB family protein [Ferruginibacter profundus]
MTIETVFLQSAIKRLSYYKELGDKTFVQLNDAGFHFQPNEASNSIAIIIQHVAGNMLSRWTDFLTSDGEKEWRNRDIEFEEQQMSKTELIAFWEKAWQCCLGALHTLTTDDLLKTVYIRGEGLLVVDAINRQLAHYPYHVGQIIYIGKIIANNNWNNLSIAKGHSEQFNNQMNKKG